MNGLAMLPWLEQTCRTLQHAHRDGRLGHALLLQGGAGLGGDWLAHWIAALTQCREADAPCLKCGDCQRVFADQQPDCQWIQPIEDSKEIRIEQVRELAAELALTRHGRGRKVVTLAPADRLNRNAANALLKTLEEPSAESLLLLVAAHPSRLPATVRSRCQLLRLPKPSAEVAIAWLESQRGAGPWAVVLDIFEGQPLSARDADLAQVAALARETFAILDGTDGSRLDPLALAESWQRSHYDLRLRVIENWLTKRLRQAAGVGVESPEMRAGAHLSYGHKGLNMRQLFGALDATREARQLAETPINKTLVLEKLLWILAGARAARRTATA